MDYLGAPYYETVEDEVKIWHVSFCEPCGFVSEYGIGGPGEKSYRSWSPSVPGTYRVGILINDDCQNSQKPCCRDEPVAVWFSVQVLGDQEGPDPKPFDPRSGLGLGTQGLLKTFSLGTTYDGESVGALEIAADGPGPSLAQPGSLRYPFENPNDPNHEAYKPGVFVYRHGAYDEFQVKTPHLIVDVQRIDAFSYRIGYYALNQLGTWQGDHYDLTGSPYRKYEIENPDGGSADDRLFITESVLENSSYTERATYEYDAFGVFGGTPPSTHGWELAIKQGALLYASAVLTIAPTTNPNGFVRTLVVSDPWDAATYEETETWKEFTPLGATSPVALPIERVVDPSGAALTTEWDYDDTTNDLRLKSVKRPDGSWTWYLQAYDPPPQTSRNEAYSPKSAAGATETGRRSHPRLAKQTRAASAQCTCCRTEAIRGGSSPSRNGSRTC